MLDSENVRYTIIFDVATRSGSSIPPAMDTMALYSPGSQKHTSPTRATWINTESHVRSKVSPAKLSRSGSIAAQHSERCAAAGSRALPARKRRKPSMEPVANAQNASLRDAVVWDRRRRAFRPADPVSPCLPYHMLWLRCTQRRVYRRPSRGRRLWGRSVHRRAVRECGRAGPRARTPVCPLQC